MTRSPFRRLAAASLAVVMAGALVSPSYAAPSETDRRATYRNPISRSFADTFADPSIIEAKDGWWYAYSTADPLRAGDKPGIMHIARTRDFVRWQYQGTVFNAGNRPTWAADGANLWAPDVRYIDGQYVIYFTVTDTTLNAVGNDSAIGVATSPTPVGPWTPSSAPVVGPRLRPGSPPGSTDFLWTFDPSGFTDVNGQRYLYFGSYNGGVWVTEVSDDGLTATTEPKLVAIDNKFEGAYVVRHDTWYYLMASSANCCAGPATGYSVFSGRSRSPMGPFVDADGISLVASKAGGTILVTQNGNRWIGAGHHAIATDHAGRDWLVYHALDRKDPWLEEPFGINKRPMLLDRIDWIDGWPRTRAGAGPSEGRQPAPVTGTDLGINSANPAAAGFRGLTAGPEDPQAGRTAALNGAAQTRRELDADRVRVRLDFAGDRPLRLQLGDRRRVVVTVRDNELSVATTVGRTTRSRSAAISLDSDGWHTLVVEVDRSRVLAQVSEDDLNDPYAEVRLRQPGLDISDAPLRLRSSEALVDNISVRRLAKEANRLVPVPQTRGLLYRAEFNRPLSDDWRWIRRDPDATVSRGSLNWPVQGADLVDQPAPATNDTAGVLLNDATPNGNWIAETKLHLDLGETEVRNFQQAGIIAYENDDDFARLSSVAIWNTRQTEFGREVDATPRDPSDDRTIFGGAIIGTPDSTVWLRLAHTRSKAREHLYRAGTSRDGRNWTWGAVWTFDADSDPEIGLIAHGGENPAVTARFDYLRFYASNWTGPMG